MRVKLNNINETFENKQDQIHVKAHVRTPKNITIVDECQTQTSRFGVVSYWLCFSIDMSWNVKEFAKQKNTSLIDNSPMEPILLKRYLVLRGCNDTTIQLVTGYA